MSDGTKYKIKHRLPPITRLCKYEHLPPPLMGDPPDRNWRTWEERCRAVYHWMIVQQHGNKPPTPEREQRGLWFYAA
jgi:hypothetical protein